MSDTTDITLAIDDLDPDDIPRVWQALSNVAQGFLLDGHKVAIHTYKQRDDGGWDATSLPAMGPEREAE